MIKVVNISLENEMDLVLAHRRSMKVADTLGLTIATQTTFATAVSEIARTVIEHTNKGQLDIGLEQNKQRYSLLAVVTYEKGIRFTNADAGFYYAQKLVPEFELTESDVSNIIAMKIGLPRSVRLDPGKIHGLKKYFEEEAPLNAYDEIKQRNHKLSELADIREEELRESRFIDEKKTEFMSIASHEIKTPITIIKAYTQIAKGLKDQSSDQMRELINKVDQQTSKLLFLVQQLLDISRVENGSLQYNTEPVALTPFIIHMVDILQHILPDYKIITVLPKDATVNIDKIRMEQVFSNLIGNAAKYSSKNTCITIECSCHADHVQVAVSDQGIGMSKSSIKSIFDKFYRDKDVVNSHSGLGMGLYISSKIISDHGGKIWAESTEGKGSTFFFTLPNEAMVNNVLVLNSA